MYVINQCDDYSAYAVAAKNDIQLWHRWLDHADHDTIAALHKATTGMPPVRKKSKKKRCVDCMLEKIKRLYFLRKHSWRATQPLNIVHVDLC